MVPLAPSQLPIYVINLDRRPDRLAFMANQLDGWGLKWQRFAAVDAAQVPSDEPLPHVSTKRPILRMSRGSQCCLVSNVQVWRQISASESPAAIILQDDVELSPEFASLARSSQWIPDGFELIQLEKTGRMRSTRLLGATAFSSPVAGIELRELRSRTGGAGAYLITREGAQLAEQLCHDVRFPIDHYLFNPNISVAARRFRIAMLRPSVARQRAALFESDIQVANPKKSLRDDAIRAWYEVNMLPKQISALLRGEAQLMPVWFKGQ